MCGVAAVAGSMIRRDGVPRRNESLIVPVASLAAVLNSLGPIHALREHLLQVGV